jgi:hypothetical protein
MHGDSVASKHFNSGHPLPFGQREFRVPMIGTKPLDVSNIGWRIFGAPPAKST